MSILFRSRVLVIALFSTLILISCKQSENTVVIEDAPTSSDTTDTTAVPQNTGASFTQLTMGEVMPIRSLDPLFVDNASSMRAVQFIFEGLARYNENGEVVPAVAKKWSIKNDQTYKFTLHSDLFYHDNRIFSNGLGRRLVASDVKYVFERMAMDGVPAQAANLFMNIQGFEPYFQEQQQALSGSDRQLEAISGITVQNDSTISFTLAEPDQEFLNKLATPYAAIYPKEATDGNEFKAVGTGPFVLSQKRSDSLYILAKFENYRIDDQPKLNRLDIQTSSNETAMLNALARGDIHLIPQLGPEQMRMALNANGQLKNSGDNNVNLFENNGTLVYFLRYNTGADISKVAVVNALNQAEPNGFLSGLPADSYEILWSIPESSTGSSADSLTSTYSADPFVRQFYNELSGQLNQKGVAFSMSSSRVQNRNTPLYAQIFLPYNDFAMSMAPDNTLAAIVVSSHAIARNNLQNIQFNNLPWWIDLREAGLSSTDNRP